MDATAAITRAEHEEFCKRIEEACAEYADDGQGAGKTRTAACRA